jgi:hypothetical protein
MSIHFPFFWTTYKVHYHFLVSTELWPLKIANVMFVCYWCADFPFQTKVWCPMNISKNLIIFYENQGTYSSQYYHPLCMFFFQKTIVSSVAGYSLCHIRVCFSLQQNVRVCPIIDSDIVRFLRKSTKEFYKVSTYLHCPLNQFFFFDMIPKMAHMNIGGIQCLARLQIGLKW